MSAIHLTWTDNSDNGEGLATDVLHGCINWQDHNDFIPIPPTATRQDEGIVVQLPTNWITVGQHFNVYCAFKSADGLQVTETFHTVVPAVTP